MAAKDDGLIRVECRLSTLPLVLQWLKIAPVKYSKVKWTNVSVVCAESWNCQKQRSFEGFSFKLLVIHHRNWDFHTWTTSLYFSDYRNSVYWSLTMSWYLRVLLRNSCLLSEDFLCMILIFKIFNLHWRNRVPVVVIYFCSKAF